MKPLILDASLLASLLSIVYSQTIDPNSVSLATRGRWPLGIPLKLLLTQYIRTMVHQPNCRVSSHMPANRWQFYGNRCQHLRSYHFGLQLYLFEWPISKLLPILANDTLLRM